LTTSSDFIIFKVANKITAEMLAEEEKLEKQRELEEEEERRKAKEKLDEEETEKRLKRLAVLLNQSEFFSSFIAKRIEEQKAADIEKNAKSSGLGSYYKYNFS